MEWIPDVERGAWLKERLNWSSNDMHAVVPRGFQAYARIFHPASRDRPAETKTWHGYEPGNVMDFETETVTWQQTADAFGTEMHALAQFHRLVRTAELYSSQELDPAGWRYTCPRLGNLDVGILAAVAAHLAEHTSTPDDGAAAVWGGWGGLTTGASCAVLTATENDDGTLNATQSPQGSDEPGTGILPRAVATGPELELPQREYYLFDAGATDFAYADWPSKAPWISHTWDPQSPSIIWPEDHAWVLVSEIDFDSTIVAGSLELVSALCRDPDIEALIISEGADLTWDADVVNRPSN
ncbi:hypothetical protein BJ994_000133 [Arthrobacter pigmenti]|uniref:Uncharacterized protein n=1 Tax=Arthrobacter pigmenti TaxID=271432 RepID=A0A846RLR2_9MICC|nr:hypothetical protein [Arthrobacter pigmenti]NJC21057.1 hypothetical protein [Arthrobacter pigmenti]